MSQSTPLIVLVHGAFADASIWQKVTTELQAKGLRVICPALPMRGLSSDAAYLDAVLANLDDDLILVGHSYGGSVISHPLEQRGKIRALIFVAGFLPDAGENAGQLNALFPGSKLVPEALNIWATPTGPDIYLKAERFQEVYAGDVDQTTTQLMASGQRPIGASALEETFSQEPLWKTIPSWAVVAKQDRSIPPETLRYMALRARARMVDVDASHAVPVSRPTEIVQTILTVIKATET